MKKTILYSAAALVWGLAACGDKGGNGNAGGGEATITATPAGTTAAALDVSKDPLLAKFPKRNSVEEFSQSLDESKGVDLSPPNENADEEGETIITGLGYWITPSNQLLYAVKTATWFPEEPTYNTTMLYAVNGQLQRTDSLEISAGAESATHMDYYVIFNSLVANPAVQIDAEVGSANYYENTDEGKRIVWELDANGKFVKKSEKPYSRKFIEE